ncbi:MAG: dihydropteroate synthase [Alphaproteobacteria bacterium]|nr:dihydropteroate synthase [Alphaproteobacteria bacterium]
MKQSFNDMMSRPQIAIMGIINCTPDSFYKSSQVSNCEAGLIKATEFINDGATVLDIGGFSTRPNFVDISIEEEIKRVVPIIKIIRKHFPDVIISIDSFRADVIKEAINAGADWINDISGGDFDPKLIPLVATLNIPYICMHSPPTLYNLHQVPDDKDIVDAVLKFFINKNIFLLNHGMDKILFDPGIGFGKTLDQNWQLVKHLKLFKNHGFPILIGVSRKSFIYKYLNKNPEDVLEATQAVHFWSILNGVKMIRTHDVKATQELLKIVSYLS